MRTLKPLIGALVRTSVTKPQPKTVDPLYLSAQYKEWRETVIARAGRRCEAMTEGGTRCRKAEPQHRMFADHRIEVADGGDKFDPGNGQCLCGQHHTIKTLQARGERAKG